MRHSEGTFTDRRALRPGDVLERPYAVGGGVPPLTPHYLPPLGPPPPPPFRCLRLTAKMLLWRLRCQEGLTFKNFRPAFGGDHRGREGQAEPLPLPPPSDPPPPSPPLLMLPCPPPPAKRVCKPRSAGGRQRNQPWHHANPPSSPPLDPPAMRHSEGTFTDRRALPPPPPPQSVSVSRGLTGCWAQGSVVSTLQNPRSWGETLCGALRTPRGRRGTRGRPTPAQ